MQIKCVLMRQWTDKRTSTLGKIIAKTAIHIQIVINDHCPKCSECILFVMLIEEFSGTEAEAPSAIIGANTEAHKGFPNKNAINPIEIKLRLLNGITSLSSSLPPIKRFCICGSMSHGFGFLFPFIYNPLYAICDIRYATLIFPTIFPQFRVIGINLDDLFVHSLCVLEMY